MILSLTLNPSVDRTVFVDGLDLHESNRVVRTETDAGGKGLNLSRVAKECGASTCALAFLGGDTAELIRSVMAREGVRLEEVAVRGHTRLNVSIEDGSGSPPTVLNERGPQIGPEEWSLLRMRFDELVAAASWVAIGGSIPPGVDPMVYGELVDAAKRAGAQVLVDADGEALQKAIEHRPDLVKPNQEEVSRLFGRPILGIEAALAAAGELHERGIRHALVSMGSEGVVYTGEAGKWIGAPPKIQPCSTIGSGDSLLGGFLAGMDRGDDFQGSLRLGIACGVATATTNGAEIARRSSIERFLPQVVLRPA